MDAPWNGLCGGDRCEGTGATNGSGNEVPAADLGSNELPTNTLTPEQAAVGKSTSEESRSGSLTSQLKGQAVRRLAVIGEWMKGRVLPLASQLESRGSTVETFEPSNPADRIATLNENEHWVRSLRASAARIVDIGSSATYANCPAVTSEFNAMELQAMEGYERHSIVGEWMH